MIRDASGFSSAARRMNSPTNERDSYVVHTVNVKRDVQGVNAKFQGG
jgi:hypothetical protein